MKLHDNGVADFLDISEVGITDGLVAWYPLDGNARDYTENKNDGTVNGAVPAVGVDGKLCYEFDGVNDYIDCGNVNIPATLSLSLWVNPNTISNGQCFFGKNTSSGGNIFLFGYWPSGYDIDFGGATKLGAGQITTGSWNHLVLLIEDQGNGTVDLSLYRNSVLLESKNWANTITDSVGTTQIGMEYDNSSKSDFFGGKIQDVRIYNRALSAEEIKILYDLTAPEGPRALSTSNTFYLRGEVIEV